MQNVAFEGTILSAKHIKETAGYDAPAWFIKARVQLLIIAGAHTWLFGQFNWNCRNDMVSKALSKMY